MCAVAYQENCATLQCIVTCDLHCFVVCLYVRVFMRVVNILIYIEP